jgi:membrane protein YdbS with pleckstrin-like domain
MAKRRVHIYRVWRSELSTISFFFLTIIASCSLTKVFPASKITGELISFGSTTVLLTLPLFWLVPFFTVLIAIFKIYNYRYAVDTDGIETVDGILSFNLKVVRVRYEDIRIVETDQTLMERFLLIGLVRIGTAATGHMEVSMEGINNPRRIHDFIQHERDKRLKRITLDSGGSAGQGSDGETRSDMAEEAVHS